LLSYDDYGIGYDNGELGNCSLSTTKDSMYRSNRGERVIEVKMYKIRELSKKYLGIYCDNGVVFSDISNCGWGMYLMRGW